MTCPLLRSAKLDGLGVDMQWLLRFLRARAPNVHNGQPVLRFVEAYLSTPPSDNVEELLAPFRLAGVRVDMQWTERKQERKYRPEIGADVEKVVEEMSRDMDDRGSGGGWGTW